MHEFENLCKGNNNKNESIAPPGWCAEKKKRQKKNYMWNLFFQKPVSSNGTIAKHLQEKKKGNLCCC
jgi:hypothetical protein